MKGWMIHSGYIHISEHIKYDVKILVPIEVLPVNFSVPVIWIRDRCILNDERKVADC